MSSSSVYLSRVDPPEYAELSGVGFPELRPEIPATTSLVGLRNLLLEAGLDLARFGSPDWNPFGDLIGAGSRVLLKPNWVHHPWADGGSVECLVTHEHVIEAVLAYLEKVPGCSVILGDAPVQGCDFDRLMRACQIGELVGRHTSHFESLEVVDFRKTIWGKGDRGERSKRDCRGDEHFVMFDLAESSYLEGISSGNPQFRVTVYNPDQLLKTHALGRHRYLVAREAVEADVVINLPKLKTHKKAGITGALKNVVGINGNKEYLPHHRKGGEDRGGDCYAGGSHLKALAEGILDRVNRSERPLPFKVGSIAATALARLSSAFGGDANLEGSWHGNDTVWRMALDLQRILHYGRPDGTIAVSPQRLVLTITDAVVCGEGEGPLDPAPRPLGLLTMSLTTPAAELVHAYLMGIDYRRVPIVREAFAPGPWPLTEDNVEAVRVLIDGKEFDPLAASRLFGCKFVMPRLWAGHCELKDAPSIVAGDISR